MTNLPVWDRAFRQARTPRSLLQRVARGVAQSTDRVPRLTFDFVGIAVGL
jgi:hypothetical protein